MAAMAAANAYSTFASSIQRQSGMRKHSLFARTPRQQSICTSSLSLEFAPPSSSSTRDNLGFVTSSANVNHGICIRGRQVARSRTAKKAHKCTVTRSQAVEEPTVDNSTVLVVGGAGVGLETCKVLSTAGSWVTVYQRNEKSRKDIESLGAMLIIGDVLDPASIEKTFKSNSFDAVVVTVGGGLTNPEVDKNGPINFVDAAKKAGVKRFIMVSSIGAGDSRVACDEKTLRTLETVLQAKNIAEDHVRASGLDYTIIRPGGLLSGAPPSGKGILTEDPTFAGLISRPDVASLIFKILFDKRTFSKTFSAIDIGKVFPPGKPEDILTFPLD